MGVAQLCKPVQGDFLQMQFSDNSFDAAYAIEATCHAAKVIQLPWQARLVPVRAVTGCLQLD